MTQLDPRCQMAWLAATLLVALGGGEGGLATAALLAAVTILTTRTTRGWLRLCAVLLPLVLLVALLDTLAGHPAAGLRTGARLVVLASIGYAFARSADGEALIAGLRAMRVPYPIVFVLVVGARFVPATAADLARLRDAARLRGLQLDGPPWRQLAGWRLLLVPLLVGTVRRGLQLGEAMEARALGAHPHRTVGRRLTWRRRDTLALAVAVISVGVILTWERWTGLHHSYVRW